MMYLLSLEYPLPTVPTDTTYLRCRLRWYRHNHWTFRNYDLRSAPLLKQLSTLSVPKPPRPTIIDLATPFANSPYHATYLAWRTYTLPLLTELRQTATRLLTALDTLLPSPGRVGAPLGSLDLYGQLLPSKKASYEIDRLHRLLAAEHNPRQHQHHTNIITITAMGFEPFDSCVDTIIDGRTLLRRLFSTTDPEKRRIGHIQHIWPDSLGLDPAFWASITLLHGILSFTSHPFFLDSSPSTP